MTTTGHPPCNVDSSKRLEVWNVHVKREMLSDVLNKDEAYFDCWDNPGIGEEWSKAASNAIPTKPPSIDDDNLGLSSVAVGKLQESARAFGMTQFFDDMPLREDELVNSETAEKAFGPAVVEAEVENENERPGSQCEHATHFLKSTGHFFLRGELGSSWE